MGVVSDSERDRLFPARCVAVIATAMTFAIRTHNLGALRKTFILTQAQIGSVASTASGGYTLAIRIGGQSCDSLGMGCLLAFAEGGVFSLGICCFFG